MMWSLLAQEHNFTKDEYHLALSRSKIVFSANLQETLGISWYEGAIVGAAPIVPDRLSYSEMAIPPFIYPSIWTENWENYLNNKDKLIAFIRNILDSDDVVDKVEDQRKILKEYFFDGSKMYNILKGK